MKYIKIGNKFNWCNYNKYDDLHRLLNNNMVNRGQKPIYCENIDMYFRCADVAAKVLSTDNLLFHSRQIRQAISRKQKYRGYKFEFITQEYFNMKKNESPSKVVGDLFITD